MYLSYSALGLPEEAQDALTVLAENYPEYVAGDSGERRLASGVLADTGRGLTETLSLGFLGKSGDIADRLEAFTTTRLADTSRRPAATLRPNEDAPIDAPRAINEVYF